MKDTIFGVLQRVGRSFMLPIAILPVAGLFLGIGGSFTNMTMLEAYGLLEFMGPNTPIYSILNIFSRCGDIVFANLPLLFAMGVAIGMAKKEKEVAALSAVIAFFIMHTAIGTLIDTNDATSYLLDGSTALVVGIPSLQIGVFGGMIVGLGVAILHNRFYKIELPQIISFFGGTRFVPIISAITYLFVGIALFYVWPPVQNAIYAMGNLVNQSGYGGTFIYGFLERLLIPFGLHHVFYMPFWQTALGGTAMVDGILIEGAQNIFFAELAAGTVDVFSVSATRFMSGKFPLMIFGLPGAALAMYHTAKDSKKEVVKGLLLSAALTAMITGITEPLEFTFLFVAPLLYGLHCVGAGLAYMLMHIFNVGVGMTFSGGLIDLTLFGILQGNQKTNWIMVVVVGLVYFVAYYVVFRFLIVKLQLKTPGREDDTQETRLYTKADMAEKNNPDSHEKETQSGNAQVSALILQGLGGTENLEDVDCCATRLRVTVKNPQLVEEHTLKQSGAAGVIQKGKGIQVIFGPRVSVIKSNLDDYLAETSQVALPNIIESPNSKDELESAPEEHGKKGKKSKKRKDTKEIEKIEKTTQTPKKEGISGHKPQDLVLYAPMIGKIAPLSDTPDESFAQGMMGKGVVVLPSTGELFAPCDATVIFVYSSLHAVGLMAENGLEIMLHVGVDTVKLKGEPFEMLVTQGQTVKRGEKLLNFDLKMVEERAVSTATPMVIANLEEGQSLDCLYFGDSTTETQVMKISSTS